MTHLTEIELVMALDGEMEPRSAESAMRHMESCAECRDEFEKLGGVSKRVEAYQRELYSQPLAPAVREERLAKVSSFGFRVSSWGVAVAAVVLLAVSVAFWNYSHASNAHPIAQKQNPRDKGGAQGGAQVGAQATLSEGEPNARSYVAKGAPQDDKFNSSGASRENPHIGFENVGHPSVVHATRLQSHRDPSAKDRPQDEKNARASLNQFTELPFSDASLPLDEATVVRVELPAAALRQAGVPVEEDNASAMLQADVVLGVDGLPRGIRLVKSTNPAGAN